MHLPHLLVALGAISTALGAAVREGRAAPVVSTSPPSAPGATVNSEYVPLGNVSHSMDDDLTNRGKTTAEIQAADKAFASLADPFKAHACALGTTQVITITVKFHHVCFYHATALRPFYSGVVTIEQQKAAVALLNSQLSTYSPRFRFVHGGQNYMTYTDWAQYQRQAVISEADFASNTILQSKLTVLAKSFRGVSPTATTFPANWMRELHMYTLPFPTSAGGFSFRPTVRPDWFDGVYSQLNGFIVNPSTGRIDDPALLVHEVGHWLNLRHTFEAPRGVDSCTYALNTATAGDFVADTPKWKDTSAIASRGCPGNGLTSWSQARSPCPGTMSLANIIAGISNFMAYSIGVCQTRFTPGQLAVMLKSATEVRKFVPVCTRTA